MYNFNDQHSEHPDLHLDLQFWYEDVLLDLDLTCTWPKRIKNSSVNKQCLLLKMSAFLPVSAD